MNFLISFGLLRRIQELGQSSDMCFGCSAMLHLLLPILSLGVVKNSTQLRLLLQGKMKEEFTAWEGKGKRWLTYFIYNRISWYHDSEWWNEAGFRSWSTAGV